MTKILPILVLSVFLASFSLSGALAQDDALPEPGLTPDSPLYFLDDLWKSFRLTFAFSKVKKAELRLEFAEEKLAEVRVMAEEKKEVALSRALRRYEQQVEQVQRRIKLLDEEHRGEIAERVAEATSRHFDVLEGLLEKVPEQAESAILHARDVSQTGHITALRALAEQQVGRAAEFIANAIERCGDAAEIIARAQERSGTAIENAASKLGQYEQLSGLAEELLSRFQENEELRESLRERLEARAARCEEVLSELIDEAPEAIEDALEDALEQARRVRNPRSLDEIEAEEEEENEEIEPEEKHEGAFERIRKFIGEDDEDEKDEDEIEVCIQVITTARDPLTSRVVDFPTPCDVPNGWEIVRPARGEQVVPGVLDSTEDVFTPIRRGLTD